MYLKILENILNELGDYKIDESLCTRIVSPKSSCNKCVESCPLSCISITDKITISDNCISCGICSSKCPTRAITMKISTLEYLHHKIREGSFTSLSCRKEKKSNESYFRDFCIGSLPDEYILYLLLKSPSVINAFDSSKCENCELLPGFLDFERRKNKIVTKLKKLNLKNEDFSCSSSKSLNLEECDYDKRALLKSVFELRKIFNDTDSESEANEYRFHQIYKELLTLEKKLYGTIDVKFPQKKAECSRCEACIKLCPSKALSLEESSISLNVNQCSGCGLCEEVCYDKALRMSGISYDDFNSVSLKIF